MDPSSLKILRAKLCSDVDIMFSTWASRSVQLKDSEFDWLVHSYPASSDDHESASSLELLLETCISLKLLKLRAARISPAEIYNCL